MSKYRKALVACASVAAVFGTVAADGVISGDEAIALVFAVIGAFGVYRVPNELS